MKEKVDRAKSEKGMTYVEIICCIFIVAMFIGPICFSYVNATKIRIDAESVSKSTVSAEWLMEDLKVKMKQDLDQREKVLNNKVSGTLTDKALMLNGKANYLASDSSHAPSTELLSTLISDLSHYDTSNYSYEIAIWNMERGTITDFNNLEFNNTTLAQAAKFYTDENYKLDGFSSMIHPLTIKISPDMINAFKDSNKQYIPSYDGSTTTLGYTLIDEYTMTLEADGIERIKFESDINKVTRNKKVQITAQEIKSGTEVVGYEYEVSPASGVTIASDSKNLVVVDVDIRNLIREDSGGILSNVETYKDYVLRFNNKLDSNLIVRVVRSASDGGTVEGENLNQYIKIVVDENVDYRTSIEKVETKKDYPSFLIAIIVRDKQPAIGQPGKIIKQMLDVYCYNPT